MRMRSASQPEQVALAGDGDAPTRAEWEQAAAAVLRKAGRLGETEPDDRVWEVLSTTTLDGIRVPPLGTAEDAAELHAAGIPGEFPYTRGRLAVRPDTGWDVRAHLGGLEPAATREAALLDLQNGVTSLWVTLAGPLSSSDLDRALDGVLLDVAPVVLDGPADPLGGASTLADLIAASGTTPAPGTNLGVDPIGARLRGFGEAPVDGTVTTAAALADERGTLAVVVDGTALHDLGASDAQELGYTLALGAAYLRVLIAAGRSVDDALALVEFRYAVTDEQFPSIAKLRAARRAWSRVAQLSGAGRPARAQRQHAVTSRPMTSAYDPWVNMLRTTVAAFAAGVGGADAVTVLPFDEPLGQPGALGRRNARNTSSLLVSEARVAAVADAAGGAYAVERLTDDLARAAWAEFGRIEEAGGVEAALSDGSLLHRVADVVSRRDDEIAHRTRPLTGLTEFPNLAEARLERDPDPSAPRVRRWGAAFEALRDHPLETPVFLATLGPVAAHTARAAFAANLFAAGGVPSVGAGATADVEALVTAYGGQPVVCLCGTDSAYAAWGADAVTALRAAGAQWVVLAGRPGERTVPTDLVDDSAAVGVDALALLERTRERLS